ncbi:hypothetical protein J6590_055240 [Homalodisca vitripennis]|nr:hypothetical protein J6590_055240 [Homalodisca vitripennis]
MGQSSRPTIEFFVEGNSSVDLKYTAKWPSGISDRYFFDLRSRPRSSNSFNIRSRWTIWHVICGRKCRVRWPVLLAKKKIIARQSTQIQAQITEYGLNLTTDSPLHVCMDLEVLFTHRTLPKTANRGHDTPVTALRACSIKRPHEQE